MLLCDQLEMLLDSQHPQSKLVELAKHPVSFVQII